MADAIKKLGQSFSEYGKHIPSGVLNATSDYLANSDFISRTIGMNNSYEDIMFIVQSMGREPISLLGKDYLYIFDHVRRNYNQGTLTVNNEYNLPKFTFYKEKPTVRFANPYDDPMNLKDKWFPNVKFDSTSRKNILYSYAESDDDYTNNKEIPTNYGIKNANPGVNLGGISSFPNVMTASDILRKTNENFNHGKYRTLIARFHTNSEDSKSNDDITQTAITEKYGMSHGRNLLKKNRTIENNYDNPYCRVWTYHHQYNQIMRQIRPFGTTSDGLEKAELSGNYDTVGFRVPENKDYGFRGGSKRLDDYGVLNYRNGLVNIAPTAKIKDYFEHKEDEKITIKKCMFSIENLAWKTTNTNKDEYDQMGLSPEQKGPLGGRIMWFPPYDLTFNETVNVNWNSNQFIGRGENIYTYTNTERTGNLSFTLLIDHPSILDYWTGHKRNGMKNQGNSLLPGNGGGVDEINNQENTLLRFFAGCEILSAKPHEFKKRILPAPKKEDPLPDPPPVIKTPQEPERVKKKSDHKIYCVLYYPNNYSGADDAPLGKSSVNSVYYLMNGIGTQKYFNEGTKSIEDIPLMDLKYNVYVNDEDEECGGYEMRDKGVSYTNEKLTNNSSKSFVNSSPQYSGVTSLAQYLTDHDGNTRYNAVYGGDSGYTLLKIVHKSAAPKGTYKNSSWLQHRYYYRVDKAFEHQTFTHVESYIDTNSEKLNNKIGFKKVFGNKPLCNRLKIEEDGKDNNGLLISFADLFVAAEDAEAETLLDGLYDTDTVCLLRKIFGSENEEEIKITSANIVGLASSAGYSEKRKGQELSDNEMLAEHRAQTFKAWLDSKKFIKGVEINAKYGTFDKKDRANIGGASSLDSKLWRCACLTITYEQYSFEDAALAEDTSQQMKNSATKATRGVAINEETTLIDNTKLTRLTTNRDRSVQHFLLYTPEGRKIVEEHGVEKVSIGPNGEFMTSKDLDVWTATYQDVLKYTNGKNYFDTLSWDYDDSYYQTGINVSEPQVVERYDNEGEFFELLEKNDPFMHHLITDKIRYFDPAYHSISPEGFNARLTFLHQCTRQGPTVGAGEGSYSTAYNLSFGRPPVCVLRLGDFYYTKIIITRVNIQYDETTWDLNPEGIGVMPMFAKVSLGFTFLGGSDLAGPISRLQNAVSFNYYANTSVYDNRAEMVQYDENGSGKEIKFKPYAFPNMIWDNKKEKFLVEQTLK